MRHPQVIYLPDVAVVVVYPPRPRSIFECAVLFTATTAASGNPPVHISKQLPRHRQCRITKGNATNRHTRRGHGFSRAANRCAKFEASAMRDRCTEASALLASSYPKHVFALLSHLIRTNHETRSN